MKNNVKFYLKLVGKFLLALWLSAGIISFSVSLITSAVDDVYDDSDEASKINRCDEYLYEKQYGQLWDYLVLYDLRDEKYDMYWNAVENRNEQILEEQGWR